MELANTVPGRGNIGRVLKFPRQGQFNVVKYCRGLANEIIRSGKGQIFTYTHAQGFHGGKNAKIVTSDGFTVQCENIVVATNVPVNDRLTMITKMEPHRTYAIAARVRKGSVPLALFWDTYEPYHYVRLTPDERDPVNYDLLISGGEDHKVGQASDYEERFVRLEKWTRHLFPEMEPVEFKWSGQVLEPVDLLAYIGKNPHDHDNVYICTGDSGTGMTHSTIAGMLITDLIMRRSNPWAEIYNPSRIPTSAKLQFIEQNINANVQYKDYLTSGDIKDIEDLAPGCGGIMRSGLYKLAVYKDQQGIVHKCSAVCPHLKAIVHWNPHEKTFDCPAHGSRFNAYGKVIMGPSNSSLSKYEEEDKTSVV